VQKANVVDYQGYTSSPGNPTTSTNGRVYYDSTGQQLKCLNSDGSNCLSGAGAGGTVTNIATTSPITGGPITTTGTIACPTCNTSASAITNNVLPKGSGGAQGLANSSVSDDGTTVSTAEAVSFSRAAGISTPT